MSVEYNMLWSRIQYFLDKKEWSQSKLSVESGIPTSTLDNYKFNNVDPTFKKVCKIADALGVTTDELRGDKYGLNKH